jgi:predicted SAM-dependent methyltransferase
MYKKFKDHIRSGLRRIGLASGDPRPWPSETAKCRGRLAPFCVGDGADLGFGGDPITPDAIRIDLRTPYAYVGASRPQLHGDATRLSWFNSGSLDYVFSSHLLEDFEDTESVLREWLRVVRPGGRLVLFCPDEQRFRAHCVRTGQVYNAHHKHEHFSLGYVKAVLDRIGLTRVLLENPDVDGYSWDLVVEKLPPGGK